MLPKNKSASFKGISRRLMKNSAHVYCHRQTYIFKNCIKNRKFQDILKYLDITSVFINKDSTQRFNYKSIEDSFKFFSKYLRKLFITTSTL